MQLTHARRSLWVTLALIGAGAGYYFLRRRRFAEPEATAVSAVTGGHPEDINGMPPTENFETEGPVYDGHDVDDRHVRGRNVDELSRMVL